MIKNKNIIQILFYCKNVKIAEAKYFTVGEKNGFYCLDIIKLKLVNNISLSSLIGEEIEVKIYLKNILMLLTFIPDSYEKMNVDRNVFRLKEIYTDELYTYHQEYLDIFNGWRDGEEYTWRDFEKKEEKEAWLRCCCFWSGIPKLIDIGKTYYINNEKALKTPLDLHCLLSEVFFGERGYFGAEINSFIDCLINIERSIDSEKIDTKVIINDFDNINKNISKNVGYENYLIQISMEFEKQGFKVITN